MVQPATTKTCKWCGGRMMDDGDQDRCINCNRGEFPARIIVNGRIAEKRVAQYKSFTCCHCNGEIPKFSQYYSVIYAEASPGSIKYPDRVHEQCVEAFLDVNQRIAENMKSYWMHLNSLATDWRG